MHYRLLYADARQQRPYAYNQWVSTPAQLLTQRMRARIAQAGVKVLSTTDAAASATVLRMEVEDFAQNFDSATSSKGVLVLRASVFRNHLLVDQKTFNSSVAAPSADAAGGARALADASDAVAADLLTWLAALPPSK
jgi:cholesterol transport system auxiliary component